MNDLVVKGTSRPRSACLAGIARPMIYYQHIKRLPQYYADMEKPVFDTVTERLSYGTGGVTAIISRSGFRIGGTVYEDICTTRTLLRPIRRFIGNMFQG